MYVCVAWFSWYSYLVLAGLKSKKQHLEQSQRLLQEKIGHAVTGKSNSGMCLIN